MTQNPGVDPALESAHKPSRTHRLGQDSYEVLPGITVRYPRPTCITIDVADLNLGYIDNRNLGGLVRYALLTTVGERVCYTDWRIVAAAEGNSGVKRFIQNCLEPRRFDL